MPKNICRIACAQVKPQLEKLNTYLAINETFDLGLEKWFTVEIAVALTNAGYIVKINPIQPDKRKPDLEILLPKNGQKILVELKAGSYERNYIWQLMDGAHKYTYPEFIGCVFLGRFRQGISQTGLQTLLKGNGSQQCLVVDLKRINRQSHWWVGFLRAKTGI